jgi:hypothetical protein
MGDVERGLRVKVFQGSRSNSDSQSNSNNAEKRLENENSLQKDFTEPAVLTPPSEYRLSRRFLG